MSKKYFLRFFIFSCVILFSLILYVDVLGASSEILLEDDFDGEELDTSLWFSRTNSTGSYYYLSDGILTIFPGYTLGGGRSVYSKAQYTLSEDILIFECVAKATGENQIDFGFWGEDYEGTVNFSYNATLKELWANVRVQKSEPKYYIVIPEIDLTEWHTYRIETTENYAMYFVDGELKAIHYDHLPLGKPMYAKMGSGAYPEPAQETHWDYVQVSTRKAVIDGTIDIDPDSLNRKSKGLWVTAYIELPEGYDVSDVVLNSVTLEGVITAEETPYEIGDYNNNGIPDLMVKFDRQVLIEYLGNVSGEFTLTINGELNGGLLFEGKDIIIIL
jgi:hypothetical protein